MIQLPETRVRAMLASVEETVEDRLRARLLLLAGCVGILPAMYGASWSIRSASSSIAESLGQHANNVAMLLALLPSLIFLATLFPEDLDSDAARRCILPLLLLSDVSGVHVFITAVRAYHADRSEAAAGSHDKRVCLHIHYAVCVFFLWWGVVYPTLCFLRVGGFRNSWVVLRRGLCIE